ncbi:MAG: hypothetical protein QF415_04855 [Candidatus Undinarchaeales archaeon]|nr:hypothetical protein [Candidatus Undinarchaeales archaeon]MDP7493132.1 hypothetical protein [Candidatus Undinarchaeales archaeon]
MPLDMGRFMGGGADPQLMNAINEASKTAISNSRRIRMLEDRIKKVSGDLEMLNNNYMEESKKTASHLKNVTIATEELRDQIGRIIKELKLMRVEMQKFAPRGKLLELESFIDLVNPANILTSADVERIARNIVEERK